LEEKKKGERKVLSVFPGASNLDPLLEKREKMVEGGGGKGRGFFLTPTRRKKKEGEKPNSFFPYGGEWKSPKRKGKKTHFLKQEKGGEGNFLNVLRKHAAKE